VARKGNDEMSIIFDDSEAAGNGCPPAGRYLVEITETKEKKSRRSGDGMVTIRTRIVEGDHAGYSIFDNIMLTGRGAGIGASKARAFGVRVKKGQPVNARDFIGRRAYCLAAPEEYRGKTHLQPDIDQGEDCGYDAVLDAPSNEVVEKMVEDAPGEETFEKLPF
jgi:hypothetical protein